MNLIENLNLGPDSFWYHFRNKTSEQQWEKFHAHQGLEFLYIHEGNGHIVLEKKIYAIRPNTLICIQPYQLHKFNISASLKTPYIRTMFVFDPLFVDQYMKPFPALHSFFRFLWKGKLQQQLFDINDNQKIVDLLFDFNQRIETVEPNFYREEMLLFSILFLRNLRELIPASSEESLSKKRNLRHVEKAMEWIEKNYKEEFVLGDLASELHLSAYHISHLFREEMGCTITEYIMAKRLQEACLLLSSTTLSIQEIGKKIGLQSDSYFSHLFKKNIGMTPKQYRASSRKIFSPT